MVLFDCEQCLFVQQTKISPLIENLKNALFHAGKNPALNRGGEFSSTVAANLVERDFARI